MNEFPGGVAVEFEGGDQIIRSRNLQAKGLIGELKRHTSFVTVDVSIRVNATMALGAILSAAKDPDPDMVKDVEEGLEFERQP